MTLSIIFFLLGFFPHNSAIPISENTTAVPSVHIASHHKLIHTRNGNFLINTRDTFVGKSLDAYGEWCESEVNLFRSIVRGGDVVVDVGANIGAFTVPLAKMVGYKGCVVAYEPQRQLHQLLSANIALNEIPNAFLYQQAVGEFPGTIIVPRVNYSTSGNFGGISLMEEENWKQRGMNEIVDKVSLDSLMGVLSDCPAFVKIDVEGMEFEILMGSKYLINTCSPVFHIENNCKKDSEKIVRILHDMNYRMVWDIHSYYNENNFYGLKEDIFTDAYLSMNILAVPKVDLRGRDFSRLFDSEISRYTNIDVEKPLLSDYVLNYKGNNVKIEQLGDMDTCKR